MNIEELGKALNHASRSKLGRDLADLEIRRQQFYDDLQWLKIDEFEIKRPNRETPYFHYTMGEQRNSIENADPSHAKDEIFHVRNFDAPGLAFGELYWLYEMTQVARRVIPKIWGNDEDLRQDIAAKKRRKHFNTLNEIFWISRWMAIEINSVKRGFKISAEMRGDVDWHATLRSVDPADPVLTLNIEVKNLASSLRYAVGADLNVKQFVEDGMQGLDSKFPDASGDNLNVLCVTVYFADRAMIQSLAEAIFAQYTGIDMIVIWLALAGYPEHILTVWRNTDAEKYQKSLLAKGLFKPPGPEHQWPLPSIVPLWGILPWQQD